MMKKAKLILVLLLVAAFNSYSQAVTPTTTSANGVSAAENPDKYHVALCGYKTDTLTYEQLKECNEINITNDPQTKITFYSLVCRLGESDIYEFAGRGNTLPGQVIEVLISNNVTQFWLEEITVKKDNTKLDIGTRKFYLRN